MNRPTVRTVFKVLLIILNSLAVIGLLLSYAAGYFAPEKYWLLPFFGLVYPVFLLINLLFILLWLVLWKRTVFFSLVAVLLGWNMLLTIYPFRFTNPVRIPEKEIKLTSFNVHNLYGNSKGANIRETRKSVIDFLQGISPDIVCFQEFYEIANDSARVLNGYSNELNLKEYYYANYRQFWNKQKINAIATFSRFPMITKGQIRIPDRGIFAIYTDLLIQGDTVRVYNVHLESVRLSEEDYDFYSGLTGPGPETLPIEVGSKRIFWKLKKAFRFRAQQVESLTREIRSVPYPVIVAGDFNDSPYSYTYHQISQTLSDAFIQAGNEFIGSTYAGKYPAYRIDFIMYSDGLKATSYSRKTVDFSDHYPITATLLLNP